MQFVRGASWAGRTSGCGGVSPATSRSILVLMAAGNCSRSRAGTTREVAGRMTVTALNDQHAYLRLPADDPLAVGDFVGCGISHPCTAFDKWRLIPLVDDDYTVLGAVETVF